MDKTSITFIASFINTIFSGEPANLKENHIFKICTKLDWVIKDLSRYSMVNQATLVVSIRESIGFSTKLPFISYKWSKKLLVGSKWIYPNIQCIVEPPECLQSFPQLTLQQMILRLPRPTVLQCCCLSAPSDPTETSGDQKTFLFQSLPQLPGYWLSVKIYLLWISYCLKSCSSYFHFFHHIFSSSTIFFTEKINNRIIYKNILNVEYTHMQHSSIQFSSIIQYSRSFLKIWSLN